MLPLARKASSTEQVASKGTAQGEGKQKKKKDKSAPESAPEPKQQKGPPRQLTQKTPQWQDFWREAWKKAGESQKDSTGPLDKLWHKYKDSKTRQDQILREGDLVYGTLSANIHDFESPLFDPLQHRNVILVELLTALAPDKENIQDGEVDWDKEWRRWLLPKTRKNWSHSLSCVIDVACFMMRLGGRFEFQSGFEFSICTLQ